MSCHLTYGRSGMIRYSSSQDKNKGVTYGALVPSVSSKKTVHVMELVQIPMPDKVFSTVIVIPRGAERKSLV